MKAIPFLMAIGCLMLACSSTIHVRGDYSAVTAAEKTALSEKSLEVETFGDLRNAESPFFKQGRENDGKCRNSEEHYEKGKLMAEINATMIEYFQKRQTFKETIVQGGLYRLSGKIKDFSSEQETSTGAAVGAQFGLIGALATANSKSKGAIRIEFSDLLVTNTKTGKKAKVDNVVFEYAGELPIDAYCWSAYRNANENLIKALEILEKNLVIAIQKGKI